MAKITLTDIASGYTSYSTYNANNTLLEAAIENTLSRDGSSPNTMSAVLDMNSYNINNLPDATANQQPVTLAQAASITGVTNPLSQENVGAVLYPRTAAEVSAGVTPTSYYYPPLNVKRYGAIGDGVTDDTAAINTGLSVLAEGEWLYCPAGTYVVTTQLTPSSNVYTGMRGDGESTQFDISGVGAGNSFIEITKRGTDLRDLQINGDLANAPNYTVFGVEIGSTATAVSNVRMSGVRILYCAKGLVLNNCNDCREYRDLEFYRNTTDVAVMTTASSSQRFTNCQFLESEQCLDVAIDATNYSFMECTFSAHPYLAPTKPVNVDYSAYGLLFMGCRFEHKSNNLAATNWDSLTLDGFDTTYGAVSVTIRDNYFTGLQVENHINAVKYVEGLVVMGNLYNTEPNTADLTLGASTVVNVLEGGNYWGAARSTQSTIVSLATSTGMSRLPSEGTLRVEHATPLVQVRELDGGTNEKNWDIASVAGQLRHRAVNDADSGWTNYLTVDRTGTNVTSVNFPNTAVDVGGALTSTQLQVPTSTTTELADVSDAVNVTDKVAGTCRFNTTTSKPVWSVGATAGSVWVDATGATAHTPV